MLAAHTGSVPLLHRLSGEIYQPLPPTAERITGKEVMRVAERLGFRFLGVYTMMGLVPYVRPRRERWVDPTGVVVMSARRGSAHGPVEATMSMYLLSTLFDDGTAVTTWGKSVHVPSGPRTIERGGTGELDFDYASHLEAVREMCKKGKKALTVSDLATTLALANYYERFLRPESITSIMTTRFMLLALIVFGIWQVVRRTKGH